MGRVAARGWQCSLSKETAGVSVLTVVLQLIQ
jgi:hypothetical protein